MLKTIRTFLPLVFSSILFVGLIWFLGFGFGSVPALAPLFHPAKGLWGLNTPKVSEFKRIQSNQLKEEVKVYWDQDRVPRIEAQNRADLYFVQGYLTAQERLFQMDIQSRLGGAELSELIGPRTLEMDRFLIRIGQRFASRVALSEALKDPETFEALDAYSKGVNEYIRNLDDEDLPPEYLILGAKPKEWSPLRTMNLLKMMSYMLSGRSRDLMLTEFEGTFGEDFVNLFFPPVGKIDSQKQFKTSLKEFPEFLLPLSGNGSNNWAVSSEKSKTGNILLANDTHLSFSLPAIWYEVELIAPGLRAYGASLPGSPGVLIGSTASTAWAVTNAASDVFDWYEVEFKDPESLDFWFDGKWNQGREELERIFVRGKESEELKTPWVLQGPVIHRQGALGLALRWTSHDPSNELKTFLQLNQSQDYRACKEALKFFKAPAQNFLCVDTQNLGLVHQGRFPRRDAGQGRLVMNGRTLQSAWPAWIEDKDLPQVENPKSGYIRSANQDPTGEESFDLNAKPIYLGWDHEDPYRAQSIREKLEAKSDWTLEDFKQLQNDSVDFYLKEMVQFMMPFVFPEFLTTPQLKELYQDLSSWDYSFKPDSKVASFVEEWIREFESEVWEGVIQAGLIDYSKFSLKRKAFENWLKSTLLQPNNKTAHLILSKDQNGNQVRIIDLIRQSFLKSFETLTQKHGPYGDSWQWGSARPLTFDHVGRIPGFGEILEGSFGNRNAIASNKPAHGAVWKMLVEMNKNQMPRLLVNYPGGQSGHPFSKDFTRFLKSWGEGQLREVSWFQDEELWQGTKWVFQP